MSYIALIHKDDAGYGITVPDCPGCTAAGETVDETLRNGIDALRLWVEAEETAGRAVPTPREIDALVGDADVAANLAGGAILALLPLPLDARRH